MRPLVQIRRAAPSSITILGPLPVNYQSFTPTNIDTDYDTADETNTSDPIDIRAFRYGLYGYHLVSVGFPLDMIFRILFAPILAGPYKKFAAGFWSDLRRDDTICAGAGIDECWEFPAAGGFMKVQVASRGGTGALTKFTLSDSTLMLKD